MLKFFGIPFLSIANRIENKQSEALGRKGNNHHMPDCLCNNNNGKLQGKKGLLSAFQYFTIREHAFVMKHPKMSTEELIKCS